MKKSSKKVKKTLDKRLLMCYYLSVMMRKMRENKTNQSLLDDLAIIREDIKDVNFSIQNGNVSDVSILRGLQEVEASILHQLENNSFYSNIKRR